MGWLKNMSNNIKRGLRSWLNINPASPYAIQINETIDYELNAIRNRIWYRGDGNELEQMYQHMAEHADKHKFWASRCTPGMEMRKIHTGLPGLIVRILTGIILEDMNDFEFENPAQERLWQDIEKASKFRKKFEKSLKEVLYIGDGAYKVVINTKKSEYPLLRWYPGERIELVYDGDELEEVVFKTPYMVKTQQYILYEHYGHGYIRNELYRGESQVELTTIDNTKNLQDWEFDESVILAVPLQIYESAKWDGRGGSIFDGKLDSFDAFDESWSQWMDALRKCRAIRRVPEDMIPHDVNGGKLLKPNPFDNSFIETKGGFSENGGSKIEIDQPAIPHESYLASYVTALDLCLQGIISPSTLGIDMKKLDNAEAQREKEKATLYTRNAIIEALQETLPEVVAACINAYNLLCSKPVEEVEVNIPFGEYANPSFESQVETIAKAKQGGIMSIEMSVEELYGDTLDDECKEEEIRRLKSEQGIADIEEPAVALEEAIPTAQTDMAMSGAGMLNGAQIASLMSVIKMVKESSVTRSEAISIITSTLGISKENAESFIEEGVQNESSDSKPGV